jgi:hypothetical protein
MTNRISMPPEVADQEHFVAMMDDFADRMIQQIPIHADVWPGGDPSAIETAALEALCVNAVCARQWVDVALYAAMIHDRVRRGV